MLKKENSDSPYLDSDPAHWAFQYLEDLSTGYWYAQVLFTAVEVDLFGAIEAGCTSSVELGEKCGCKSFELSRLLVVLQRMDLIHRVGDDIFNSQLAKRFLVPDAPDYMGDFILYRRYMQIRWNDLTGVVADSGRPVHTYLPSPDDDYKTRNFYYVRAMDRLARLKANEIVSLVDPDAWRGPVLDVGGGAGALCRALVTRKPLWDVFRRQLCLNCPR